MPETPQSQSKPTAPPPAAPKGPEPQKLRFLAKGSAMVPHYESQHGGTRRFHGWKHDATLGPKFKHLDVMGRETGQTAHHGAFVKQLGQIVSVGVRSQFAAEYLRHLRDGDLWPADEFTARMAKVKFDPSFGAEHGEDAQAAHEEALAAAAAMTAEATAVAEVEEAQTEKAKG